MISCSIRKICHLLRVVCWVYPSLRVHMRKKKTKKKKQKTKNKKQKKERMKAHWYVCIWYLAHWALMSSFEGCLLGISIIEGSYEIHIRAFTL